MIPDAGQFLPQSPDAERGVLSSFLLAPREVGRICAERKIGTGSFSNPVNADIYAVLLEMWAEDKPIDFIMLTQVLRDRSLLDRCGGAGNITELFTFLPTAANVSYYIEILEEKRILREIITVCCEYAARSHSEQDDFPGILGNLQSKVAAIGAHETRKIQTMKENVVEAIDTLNGRLTDSDSIIRTGLAALDDECGPLERGHLLVIGGQTKAGKSILAGQIALNMALEGKPVLFISLEMTERELTLRWLSSLARVDMRMVKAWSEADHGRFNAAQSTLATLPITIVTRRFQLSEIVATCQQISARQSPERPLAGVFLDYAQLCSSARHSKEERRQQEIAEISRTSKRLAGTLNCLFVLLTQLNDDGRSREARDIEHDANLFVEVGHNKDTGDRGVKVVLARSAPSGQRLKLRIIPHHTRVEDDADMSIEEPETKKPKRKFWQ